jgi:hypothetical protein
MTAFIYGIVDPSVGYGSDIWNAVGLAGLALLHVVTGWLARGWWAVFLPWVVVPIAVPAGYTERGEDALVWQGMAFFVAPVGAALIAAGVGARKVGRPWWWERPP